MSSSPTLSSLSKVSSEMDKGDYSDVKELISNNTNCGTSPFDGDSAVFYAGSNKDDSLQKVSINNMSRLVFLLQANPSEETILEPL